LLIVQECFVLLGAAKKYRIFSNT